MAFSASGSGHTRLLAAAVVAVATVACSATSEGDDGFVGTTSGTGGGGADSGGNSGSGTPSGAGGDIGVGAGVGGAGGAGVRVCSQNVDIVFVMDVSTSMGQFLYKLAEEMPVVDTAVQALNLQSAPQYGLVVFVDDAMFVNGGQPYADVAALQADFQTWSNFTAGNTQVSGNGTNTTFPENSLDALHHAAAEFPWRPAEETLRIVIHTTDDTFWQGPATENGVAIVHDYKGTVAALQQAEARVFAFAAHLGGPDEIDDVSAGWFGGYGPEKAIPAATGGAVFDLEAVLTGQISLSASINQAVEDTFCEPYPPPS